VTGGVPRVGVVTFPGSLDDRDALRAIEQMGGEAVPLWHAERDLGAVDAVVLRCGAIAQFAAVMEPVVAFAERGGPVLGICNGFQVLCEAGLLPGAMIRNRSLRFVCRDVWLRVETAQSCITDGLTPGETIEIPIKHGEGQWIATPEQLAEVEREGLVVFRYASRSGIVDDAQNPNGATNNVAGIRSPAGNVVGLMPHPEHAVDPDVGPTGGQPLFASLLHTAMAGVTG